MNSEYDSDDFVIEAEPIQYTTHTIIHMTQEQRTQIKQAIECLIPGRRLAFFEVCKSRFTNEELYYASSIIEGLCMRETLDPKEPCRQAVEHATGVDVFHDKKHRHRKLVDARRIYLNLRLGMRAKHNPESLAKLGAELGKDHSTVLHAKRIHQSLMEVDAGYREMYECAAEYLSQKLNGPEIPQQNEDRQDDSAAC